MFHDRSRLKGPRGPSDEAISSVLEHAIPIMAMPVGCRVGPPTFKSISESAPLDRPFIKPSGVTLIIWFGYVEFSHTKI